MEKKKKRVSRYLIGILILIVVNAILIGCALVWLYGTLANFEAATPAAALDRYFSELGSRDFSRIDAESGFEPTALDSLDDYHRYLLSLYGDSPKNLDFRRASSAEAPQGAHVYAVYQDDVQLGEVYLYENQGQDGGWRVCAPLAYEDGYTVTAPSHAIVLVNGQPLEPATAAENTPLELFSELPEDYPAPAMLTYSVPGALFPPVFEATGPEGAACDVAVDNDARTVAVTVLLPQETLDEYAAQMETVAKAYSNFISEDVPFSALSPHLIQGTDFYERMRTYDVGWYVDHDRFAFLDLETLNITSCSETCFVGEIRFTYEVYRGANVNAYPSHYRMAFAQLDGAWKLVELEVL